jgi:site-specific recombinase XerD
MMRPAEVERFCQHLRARHYSRNTVESYALDLQLFFAEIKKPVSRITWRDVDHFIEQQHGQGLAAATINRRLHAVKRFFDYLVLETQHLPTNPVKPSHFLKQGRPLPKKLSGQQVKQLFATISNRMDRALFLLMLRSGLRVSEVAELKLSDIDWQQKALLVQQGKGRKDRRVYLSSDTLEGMRECLAIRPAGMAGEHFFWNQKRKNQPLSIKAIQKKMERYAKAGQVAASCHSLRHTFASNLLEEGAEVILIKEFLGHESISSSERYARLSNQKVKQIYLQTIKKVIQKTKV